MKKHTKLMLKALSLAAGFVLVGNGMVVAADAKPVAAEAAHVEAAVLKAAPVAEEKHEEGKNDKHHGRRRHHGRHGRGDHKMDDAQRDEHLNARIDEHMMRRRQDPNSLYSQFEKAKAADAKNVAPKTLAEIGAMVDDSARRLELYKFIAANKTGTMVLDADKEAFKKMLDLELENMRKEAREVRELIGNMALDNNFTLMDEKEVLKRFRETFDHHGKDGHHGRHHGEGAPKRKDARDTDGDGHVSKAEKRAAKHHGKGKGKHGKDKMVDADHDSKDDRDVNHDGVVSKEERAEYAKTHQKSGSKKKGKGKAKKGKKGKKGKKAAIVDRDHDGKDDRDTNHDGVVSKEELAA